MVILTEGTYLGLVERQAGILLDQIAIIISPRCACHFNNKAFGMVGIFLFWRDQQKHLLHVFLFSTRNSLVYCAKVIFGNPTGKGGFLQVAVNANLCVGSASQRTFGLRKASQQPAGY